MSESREIIGALQSEAEFEAAVSDLEAIGIDRARISFLAQEEIAASCTGAIGCDIAQLPRVEIELSDDARTLLGNLGYDPTYGARPLKRVIQKRLVDRLALAILEGRFTSGDVVRVDNVDGELVLERAEAVATAA